LASSTTSSRRALKRDAAPREGEREQQTHEAEHCPLDRADAFANALAVLRPVALPEAPPELEENDHPDEEPGGEQRPSGD
jgi:hypothetical protein